MRKKHEKGFQVKVALAALQEGAKINKVAAKYDISVRFCPNFQTTPNIK